MRLKNLILGDIRFQYKYGFYFIYVILTLLYIFFISIIPHEFKDTVVAILIFSDPAAMGLFFMGAIVLLEKSERTLNALTVSPVKPWEYILSKVISLAFTAEIVAICIAISAGNTNLINVVIGTFITSAIFSLIGLIAATWASTLNRFILLVIPVEIVCFVPAIFSILGEGGEPLRLYPFSLCLAIIAGERISAIENLLILALILAVTAVSYKVVSKMWKAVGGAKL